nr:hypothetical protein [Tanacetum cinerariifolium]
IHFSNVTTSASNSPEDEKDKGRNPYPIAAHLAIYLARLRCAASITARPGYVRAPNSSGSAAGSSVNFEETEG